MSVNYTGILWNRQKKLYDFVILGGVLLYLISFIVFTLTFYPDITGETMIIRAFGTLAVFMLHIILAIGPLARLSERFIPLLYNRRHLGVTMFLMAAIHGVFSILQFHVGGNVNPFVSIFTANEAYATLTDFPFQSLGFFALIILLLMAATSHDFWLKNLSPKVWKSLHMMVYVAYFLIIAHVMLGVIQLENNPVFVIITGIGAMGLVVLHLAAGMKALKKDGESLEQNENWVLVGGIDDIEDNRAKIVNANTDTIAVFKYEGKLSAISNVCKHQNGPLGEGKIIDGCITCPWHGYQYQPEDGCSPPPFTEKVSTFELKMEGQKVFVNVEPKPEGTRLEPLRY